MNEAQEIPRPKQYMLMVDEISKSLLGKMLPSIVFVPVEGMALKDNETHMLLVSPVPARTVAVEESDSGREAI